MSVNSEDALANTRRRTFEEHHKRSLDMQILDALLRIEEQLIKYGQAFYKTDEDGTVDMLPLEDVIVDVKPQVTPFQKAVAEKPAKKNWRGKTDRL